MTRAAIAAGLLWLASIGSAQAASLQVAPVLVEAVGPALSSSLTLRNSGAHPVNAQIRVFRWTQADGQERLEPTQDVVASPPAATLRAGGEYLVRIVRVAKRPVEGEESYRLLVDELPDPARQANGAVHMVLRQSIPVFFAAPTRSGPGIAWSVTTGGRTSLVARNAGERRLRLSDLVLRDARGRTVSFGDGLVGYALGRSAMRWTAPAPAGFGPGPFTISGQSDIGPIHATAPAQAAR